MWTGDPIPFSQQYGLTVNRTKWLQATAEHLHEKSDGGKISAENIVAACFFCNQARHKSRPNSAPLPEPYLQNVRKKLAKGKWHGINLTVISELR
jgi:5-methylcytosine-specific restriction endonuclease McrA